MIKAISLDGRMTMATLLGMPRPLRVGKVVDSHFVAACEFAGRLSLDKHESIMITHLCFDRAIFSAVHNRLVQLQSMRFDAFGEVSLDFMVRENSSWLTAVGCCAHDMQNAIKWGLYRAVEPGLIDDIHISTEALLSSIGPLLCPLQAMVGQGRVLHGDAIRGPCKQVVALPLIRAAVVGLAQRSSTPPPCSEWISVCKPRDM